MVISLCNTLGRTLPPPIPTILPTPGSLGVGVSRLPCVPQDSARCSRRSELDCWAWSPALALPKLSPCSTPPHPISPLQWTLRDSGPQCGVEMELGVQTRAVRTSSAAPKPPPKILSSLPSPHLNLKPNLFTISEAHPDPITPNKEGGVLGKWGVEVPSLPRLQNLGLVCYCQGKGIRNSS